MNLRSKTFIYFGSSILLFIISIYFLYYSSFKKVLEDNARNELEDKVESMVFSIESHLDLAIQSYLRGITEYQISIIEKYNELYQKGEITLNDAKDKVQNISKELRVGNTGYIVALREEDDKIIIELQPYLRGFDCSYSESCREWVAQKNGFNEYQWKNPDDAILRSKVAYIQYYEPWNWVVGSTTYKDELIELVKLENFEDQIISTRFNETGYFFIFDDNYNILVHPELEGQNILNVQNPDILKIAEMIKEKQNGFVSYN